MDGIGASNYTNLVDWTFRSRSSGRITLAQFPNLPLWLFFAALLARVLLHPGGALGAALAAVSAVLLLTWAALEIVRGVNPFRRLLGAGVAVSQLVMLFIVR